MRHLLHLIFRCDFNVTESLKTLTELNTAPLALLSQQLPLACALLLQHNLQVGHLPAQLPRRSLSVRGRRPYMHMHVPASSPLMAGSPADLQPDK